MSFILSDTFAYNKNSLDASNALPVSEKSILGNYVQNNSDLPLLLDRVSGGGAPAQVWTNGVVDMSVSAAGHYQICQTKKRHLYLAGKSQNADITLNEFGIVANTQKIVGYYNSDTVAPYNTGYDGTYLEMDGTTYNLVINKGGTPTVTVPRANWDDPLDGTGPSGLSIGSPSITNFTVLAFDFLYLGGTALRMFFKIGDDFVLAHTYRHSSIGASTMINTPVHSLRWEVRSTGGTASMGQICGDVSTGGALNLVGFPRSVTSAGAITLPTAGTMYGLIAIRLNASKLDAVAIKITGETMSTNNVYYQHHFILNPTVTGALTWVLESNPASLLYQSGIDYAICNATQTLTGGTILSSGNGVSRNNRVLSADSLFQPGSKIDGTQDTLFLAYNGFANNGILSSTLDFLNL